MVDRYHCQAHSSSASGGLRTSVPVTFGIGLFTRESGHTKTRLKHQAEWTPGNYILSALKEMPSTLCHFIKEENYIQFQFPLKKP